MPPFRHRCINKVIRARGIEVCKLKKSRNRSGRLERGTWKLIGSPEESYCYVITTCTKCGITSEIAFFENEERHQTGHWVSPEGKVSPSVYCRGCYYHPFIDLKDWDPEAVKHKEEVDG